MRRIRVWSAATRVLVALLVTMLANATLVVAHGATPAPEHGPVTALPVAIHAGYCGGVGDLAPDPVYNLGTLGPTVEPAGETLEPEDIRGVQLSPGADRRDDHRRDVR